LESDDAIVRANTILILISRTLNMMDKYIKNIGDEFKANGGFRERMSSVRSEARAHKDGEPAEGPVCPNCGSPTRLRKTRQGNRPFWGCTEYPACRGIVDYQEAPNDGNR
jgi:four helix bundle suffix protein